MISLTGFYLYSHIIFIFFLSLVDYKAINKLFKKVKNTPKVFRFYFIKNFTLNLTVLNLVVFSLFSLLQIVIIKVFTEDPKGAA